MTSRLVLALAILCMPVLGACGEVERMAQVVSRVVAPGSGPGIQVRAPTAPGPPAAQLPPEQTSEVFDFERIGTDPEGRSLYRIEIHAGGSPSAVAATRLTPLFRVDGKEGPEYVADAYFRANPGRTPSSIQPGDEFVLALPPDAFVVRWQEDREEDIGHRARLREYVSERGDRLRYYLTDPFPIRYELRPADRPGLGIVHFHPDLPYMLGTGRTDPLRLARLVYRVPDPDMFQVEAMRRLATDLQPGTEATLEIDRTRAYLDPVREALAHAAQTEPVPEPERAHLTRATFSADQPVPFLAVEDGLGTRTDLSELPPGRVFRIEYGRDGTVRVSYKTGPDDALGRRDPYLLRENERWAALYERLAPRADTPTKWGPAEPSDLAPFPTARDPHQRSNDPERAYDYLVPGRAVVLTFRPTRFRSDERAQRDFLAFLHDVRERYGEQLVEVLRVLESRTPQEAPSAGRPNDRG